MAKPAKHALTVLAQPDLRVTQQDDLKKFSAAAVEQCRAVTRHEAHAAAGAVLAGLALHRVKASLQHGEFGGWIAEKLANANFWTPATAKLNASYYMRLALAFADKVRADRDMLLALPSDATSLELADTEGGRKLAAALEKFVGAHSLTELLIKHGIKGVGLKTDLDAEANAEDEANLTPEQRAARAQALREATWAAAWNGVQQVRTTFTDPNTLQHLTDPQQVEQLKDELVEAAKLADERLKVLRAASK